VRKLEEIVYVVDVVIITDEGIPLIKRRYSPYKDHWAIPGGHLDIEDYVAANGNFKKALEIAAIREAKEEVVDGEVKIIKKIGIYNKLGRDPRGNYVSHAYIARIVNGRLRPNTDAKEVCLFKQIPSPMAFDHEEILRDSKVFETYKYGGR
jgi:8-oxo-dGTP diphosphatase